MYKLLGSLQKAALLLKYLKVVRVLRKKLGTI